MGSRIHQRLKAVLPVRVTGKAADGKAFDELTYTLDISRSGVRLVLPKVIALDENITITYRQRKAAFKVMWVGSQNGGSGNVGGLAAVDPSVVLWSELRKEEKENYRDDYVREERERQEAVRQTSPPAKSAPAPKAASASAKAAGEVGVALQPAPRRSGVAGTAAQVAELTASLLAIEAELHNDSVDAGLLKEFRDALAKTRETAWMVQQRLELQKQTGEGQSLPLISVINNERLHTVARVCTEFMEDFSKADLALDEKVVSAFLTVAEQLVFELGLSVS